MSCTGWQYVNADVPGMGTRPADVLGVCICPKSGVPDPRSVCGGGGGRTEASPPKIWVGRSSSLVGPAQALGLATRACVQSLVGLFTCACVHAPSRMHEREQRELCLFNAQAEK